MCNGFQLNRSRSRDHFEYDPRLSQSQYRKVLSLAELGRLQRELGLPLFLKLFPAIPTDQGSEFMDVVGIEADEETGEVRTRVFFCDAYVSSQKGATESNHRLIRYVLPKRTSFEALTPRHVALIEATSPTTPGRSGTGPRHWRPSRPSTARGPSRRSD